MTEVVLQFSGGTDSTAAAVLLARTHERIHLVTYTHSGISAAGNPDRNVERLRGRFGADRFVQHRHDVEGLFRFVVRDRYLATIRRHGLMVLGSCGLCKLAMHVRTVVLCRALGVSLAADGANRNTRHFPDQMAESVGAFRNLYARFGLTLENPVFDLDHPSDLGWLHKAGLLPRDAPDDDRATTGRLLLDEGILDSPNVKGTEEDRRMQAHCSQFLLSTTYVEGWFVPTWGEVRYREATNAFYAEKVARMGELLEAWFATPERSPLRGLLDG